MTCKRWISILMCALLFVLLPTAVCAERPESMDVLSKSYELNITETRGSIEANPATPAFWEYPVLRAGESYVEGAMTIRNNSNYTASMMLNEITLPYGDSAKLAYLDHLELTVKEGDQVLFDNTYAHVNDEEGGLSLSLEAMAPGEEHTYTITLRCRYDYTGDPYADVSQVAWLFGASTQTTTYEDPDGLPAWVQLTVIIFAVMIVLLVLIMVIRAIVSKKKAKES